MTSDKRQWWDMFKEHHYLTHTFNTSSQVWIMRLDDTHPIGLCAWMHWFGDKQKKYTYKPMRIHRVVMLPEYQGIGAGKKMIYRLAQYYEEQQRRVSFNSSHPKVKAMCEADPDRWTHARSAPEAPQGRIKTSYDRTPRIIHSYVWNPISVPVAYNPPFGDITHES